MTARTSPASRAEGRRRRALKALRDGQVQVRVVLWGQTRADVVEAVVAGFTGRHTVALRSDTWRCSCTDGADGGCAHVLAVRLVTGHALVEATTSPPTTPVPSAPAVEPEQGEVECLHGTPASWCPICTDPAGGPAQAERDDLLARPGWTIAVYRGRCHHCGRGFAAGEPIRLTPGDGKTAWAGRCCGRR